MPRKLRLTWQPGVKGQPGRWKKIYKKKAYYFDGGRGKSDHEAYDKAYAEWEKLKAKIDAESPKRHHAEYERAITEWEDVLASSHQFGDDYMAETATRKLAHLRKNQAASNPPPIDIADTFAGQFVLSIRDPAEYEAGKTRFISHSVGSLLGINQVEFAEFPPEQVFLEKLFLQPHRDGHVERLKPLGRERQIGFQKPLKFKERLVVKGDEVHVPETASGMVEAEPDGVFRKTGVVFFAGEAFFLGGSDDAAVLDQRRGAVVVEGGNSENAQRTIPIRKSCK